MVKGPIAIDGVEIADLRGGGYKGEWGSAPIVKKVFGDPAFHERFRRPNVLEPRVTSPEEFAAAISRGAEKWGAIIRRSGARAQ